MAQTIEYTNIFSTPIWTADLEPAVAAKLNAHLATEVDALARPLPPLAPGANWQTAPILQDLPQFADLTRMIERHGRKIADFLQLKATDLVVSGCWANINPPGGRNPVHCHPNNFLSGTYYVSLPDDEGAITFEDPRPQAHVMMPPRSCHNAYNSNVVTVQVKPGRLIVFPSWLSHSVPVNGKSEDRISIAFNLMFPDYVKQASPAGSAFC